MRRSRSPGGWIVSAKAHSTTLSPDREHVYGFDLEGRPLTWFEGDRVYKRSLASAVVGRRRSGGRRRHWQLSRDEAAEALGAVLRVAASVPDGLLDVHGRDRVEAISRWTAESLLAERSRYDAVYGPIGILPPDQYLSVVLQATFGCSWNRCTFCGFYGDRAFRARPIEEFASHARAVHDLLGRGEMLRPRVFLASGNALVMGHDRLREVFRVVGETFPGRPISSFVDVLTGERKSVADWRELRDLGLRRIHVGIETGDDELLAWLNKPGSRAASADFVSTVKRAGLAAAVVFMVGVGGDAFASAHVRSTLSLAGALPLGREDIVYLSPFREDRDSEYARRAHAAGIRGLGADVAEEQYAALRDGIRDRLPGVRVTRYDIREFVY